MKGKGKDPKPNLKPSKSCLRPPGSVFFVSGLSFYLDDAVNSHLLLSLAGLVRCNVAPTLVKPSCALVYSGMSHELRSCLLPLVLLGKDAALYKH